MMAKREPLRVMETISVFGGKIKYFPIMEEKTGNTEYHQKFYTKKIKNNIDGAHGNRENMTVRYSDDYDFTKKYPVNYRYITIRETWSKTKPKLHPTQKPISLCEYLIKTYSRNGDLVLDNCAGSGSTLVAAKNLDRQFIGIEKDEAYFEISKKRLSL